MSTVTINGNTWTTETLPTTPAYPASLEFQQNNLVAENTSTFTAQQQFFNWNVAYKECSVSYATMTNSAAQAWTAFLASLQGPVNVFCFPVAICNLYTWELTLDNVMSSSNPRFWRLKSNSFKWAVAPGGVHKSLTFEVREVL